MSGFTFGKVGIGIAVVGLVGALITAGCGSKHGRHWGHRGHHGHDLSDPQAAREHAEEAAEWMLGKVDATDDQEEEVKAIVSAAVDDFADLAEQHQSQRDAFKMAFSQPIIDRGELERLRQNEMQLADTASSRLVEMLVDVAEVLTVGQRGELMEYAQRFHR